MNGSKSGLSFSSMAILISISLSIVAVMKNLCSNLLT
jgi:hypothetical protein